MKLWGENTLGILRDNIDNSILIDLHQNLIWNLNGYGQDEPILLDNVGIINIFIYRSFVKFNQQKLKSSLLYSKDSLIKRLWIQMYNLIQSHPN